MKLFNLHLLIVHRNVQSRNLETRKKESLETKKFSDTLVFKFAKSDLNYMTQQREEFSECFIPKFRSFIIIIVIYFLGG